MKQEQRKTDFLSANQGGRVTESFKSGILGNC